MAVIPGQRYRINQCSLVILAAGASSRLGSPKQLLAYQDTTLLRHAASVALSTALQPVVVVVGANASMVKESLAGMKLILAENENWSEGIASSLRKGLQTIRSADPNADGVIFMVCDQPFVTKTVLDCLLKVQSTSGKPAVASSYAGKLGTPALFHQALWPRLMELTGDTGARNLLASLADEVAAVPFERGATDIDTNDDYEKLLQQ